MGAISIAGAVALPIVALKAIRRREPQRVFEVLVCAAALAIQASNAFAPTLIHSFGILGRMAAVLVAALFIGNLFGLARWVFRRRQTPVA